MFVKLEMERNDGKFRKPFQKENINEIITIIER